MTNRNEWLPMEARDTEASAIAAAADRPARETLRWRAQTFVTNRDAIVISDLDGRILDWNPAAERIFGYTRDEVLGKTAAIIHRPEDADTLTATILDAVARDGSWHGEAHYVRKDGVTGVLETSAQPLLDAAGAVIGAFVVSRDSMEQQQREEERQAPRASERDLAEGIINSTPFGIALFEASDDFRCLRHNAPFLDLTGPEMRARGSVVGAALEEFFVASSGARVRAIFEHVRDASEEVVVEEFPAILPPDP
ncbi:MAG: PAS domain-containing protein, partial [Ktedonobacterales bacterium]